ncbi:MAG: RES domain-containing protein [Candidatus Dormibacteria bacterium]
MAGGAGDPPGRWGWPASDQLQPGPRPLTRFAFFGDPVVPVLYGAEGEEAAVAETLVHDQPAVGGRLVPVRYRGRVVSGVVPRRERRLAQLHGGGRHRLGARSANPTDTSAAHYIRTVRWADAIREDTDLDGIVWMSRQWNNQRAVVLFGDRVGSRELSVVPTLGRSFATPEGSAAVTAFAKRA